MNKKKDQVLLPLMKAILTHEHNMAHCPIKYIDFNVSWFDDAGFPTYLQKWIEENTPDEAINYHGAYYGDNQSLYRFRIHRYSSKTSNALFDAVFDITPTMQLRINPRRAVVESFIHVPGEKRSVIGTPVRYVRTNDGVSESWILLEKQTYVYQVRMWDYVPADPGALVFSLNSMQRAFFEDMSFKDYMAASYNDVKSIGHVAKKNMPDVFDWEARETTQEMRWLYLAVASDRRKLAEGVIVNIEELQDKYRKVNVMLIRQLLAEGQELLKAK